jgi:Ni/Co efflux regulator RcnB
MILHATESPERRHTMQRALLNMMRVFFLALAAAVAISPAYAEKPDSAGGGKGKDKKHAKKEGSGGKHGARVEKHFEDSHRTHVREYYAGEFHAGRCPPGLAKKRNGCMPPGQAKKWRVGQPLPRDVIFYDLPPTLVVQIGVPPPGYRFVRVASDILMIAIGTGLVVDAIQDLGGM